MSGKVFVVIFVLYCSYHVLAHESTAKLRACKVPIQQFKGDIGDQGNPGSDGPVGPPGLPGMPGTCPCDLITINIERKRDSKDFGNPEAPLSSTCNSTDGLKTDGIYNFGTPKNTFEATCNKDETCIYEGNPISVKNQISSDPFWLSQTGNELIDMYSLETDHIIWLQDHATSVRQKIKFQCKNSKRNVTDIRLRTWNHVVIGPSPTENTPLTFTMPDGDRCSKAKEGEWASMLIEIHHTNENRLPITDIWFNGISQDEEITIENVELCFV